MLVWGQGFAMRQFDISLCFLLVSAEDEIK